MSDDDRKAAIRAEGIRRARAALCPPPQPLTQEQVAFRERLERARTRVGIDPDEQPQRTGGDLASQITASRKRQKEQTDE